MQNNTEQLILKAAKKHFVQNGYEGTRMQAIADEAGINKAMLHYYFRSKDKLFQEIVVQILDHMIPRFAAALGNQKDFWSSVESLINTYIDTFIAEPSTPFFIMAELSRKRDSFVAELRKRANYFPAIQIFLQKMMQEMQQGNIKAIPPVHLMLNIIGMTVFPFIAKPIFCTILSFPEQNFDQLMQERKQVILDFLKSALRPD